MDSTFKIDNRGFNRQGFAEFLATQELGDPLYIFPQLNSTNTTLRELLDQGAPPGTTVIALQQTAGRGQRGRQWCSAPGGLYLSVAIAPGKAAAQTPQLTLCSAWGIAHTLRQANIPIWLKWPNDLYLYGRKLGGILTESCLRQGQIPWAILGVGLNWANPVPPTGINLQSALASQPQPPITSLEMLAALTLKGLEAGYHQWRTHGLGTLLPEYLKLYKHLGHPVEVKGQAGTIVGITAQGYLQVRLASTPADGPIELRIAPGTSVVLHPTSEPSATN